MTISLKNIATGTFQMIVGLIVVLYCGDGLHDELLRANRSLAIIAVFGIGLLIGALIVPGASPLIVTGAKTGLTLIKAGRRATDVKLAEIEIPPSVQP